MCLVYDAVNFNKEKANPVRSDLQNVTAIELQIEDKLIKANRRTRIPLDRSVIIDNRSITHRIAEYGRPPFEIDDVFQQVSHFRFWNSLANE